VEEPDLPLPSEDEPVETRGLGWVIVPAVLGAVLGALIGLVQASFPAPGKVSVLAFTVDGIHPHDIGTVLDRHGVAVRAGHHCAQPLMRHLGVPATARAAFAAYSTREEADLLAGGIEAAQRMFS
jgi:cysteine desulfurase/selenocysteine lyase